MVLVFVMSLVEGSEWGYWTSLQVCTSKVGVYFVSLEWLLERLSAFRLVWICLSAFAVVPGFLSVLLSTLMSGFSLCSLVVAASGLCWLSLGGGTRGLSSCSNMSINAQGFTVFTERRCGNGIQ